MNEQFADFVSLEGPVEEVNGELLLCIPLDAGGQALAGCTKGIGKVQGRFLNVTIPAWLAEKLNIVGGTLVVVHNRAGKFNIQRSAEQPNE